MNQNYMKPNSMNEWKIDSRTAGDIEDRIGELAASYVPEWHFDRENPDIGSVIAKLFAGQMEGNIGRCNQVIGRYHREFVNFLGISLLPAKPASATVLLGLVQDTIPGVEVVKGTKFLADTEDGDEQIVFETTHNLYVTSAALDYAFLTLERDGSILPLKGKLEGKRILEGKSFYPLEEKEAFPPEEEDIFPRQEEESGPRPFRLFGHSPGISSIHRNALLLYHPAALNVEKNPIYLKITGNAPLLAQISRGAYGFWYYTEEGLLPVESVEVLPDGETVVLKKEKKNAGVEIEGNQVSLLVMKALTPVTGNQEVTGIRVSSQGQPLPAESVNNGSTDFDAEAFEPFGDTLSLYQECYLGHDDYFAKAGAAVQITMDVSYREHRILDRVQGEEESLKIIKRKPRVIWVDSAADARAEEVSLEYFNGFGWKKLVCMQEVSRLFMGDQGGTVTFSFLCPGDWQRTEAGAYHGRCIRIRLLKSDNCYMRPCIHHYPHVEHLKISYSYQGRYMEPQYLVSIAGTRMLDLTRKVKEGLPFPAFSKGEYGEDALYLGFQRKPQSGPVSLLFRIEEGIRYEGVQCRFEYSTKKGFRQMKVLDHTGDFSRSGTVLFMPQADMQAVTLEGKRAYWIRVSRMSREERREDTLPLIRDICLNAVQAANVETRDEEDYYLEEIRPELTVPLGVPDILDVELWVNERGEHTKARMRQMLEEDPQSVRAEYDSMGNLTSFYVRWQEVDRFEEEAPWRSFRLDRMKSVLIFGDGVHTGLPRVQDDVAFKARIRCCNGERGNVGPGQIHETLGNLMFVDRIRNPVKAYGGSSIESMEKALKRGANLLKSRKRLISSEDYVQEILNFSQAIHKVRCVAGRTIDGSIRDNALTFCLLLKDFEEGSYSFYNIAGMLKKHLLDNCELTIAAEDLSVVEPVFARVCVDIWAEVMQMDDGFEVQNLLTETLTEYLSPLRGQQGRGWEIGTLPRRSQILMRLNVLKSKAVIRRLVVTVKYTDQTGVHEVDLSDVEENPYMVCCSGSHRVVTVQTGR